MSFRRMLPFLILNVIVSAAVVLGVLYWWDARQPEEVEVDGSGVITAVTLPPIAITAEAMAQATDTPEPEEGPPIHVVAPGDTLGNLSAFYDVPIEDIMAANDLTNADFLFVGQQLIIPIGGLPTATPEPTSTATPNAPPTPVATEPPEAGEVAIEIATVQGVGQLESEAVQIVNRGTRQAALLNWELRDEAGHVYRFGQRTIFGDGAGIMVHTGAGQDSVTAVYWNLTEAVWESGETVTLVDADGAERATLVIP
ncbi:MAG: lamin tail domain-containing protein [Ardenticatenaceae bacterium]|nr:lamin tail domain-containing protein [Ardenticatenaceae bacterium]